MPLPYLQPPASLLAKDRSRPIGGAMPLSLADALDSLARKRGQRTVTDVLDEVSDDLLPWWNRA